MTLQPVHALGVDAAILFSDLLLPLAPLGIPFDFKEGEGPVIERPVRTRGGRRRACAASSRARSCGMVLEAIRLLRRELDGKVPLIGFAGAPFTLASYAIEGGHSSNFAATKSLMYDEPAAWHRFAGLLAEIAGDYLRAQVEAGAQAVQVFDSWVGALDEADYREFVLPHVRTLFAGLRGHGVPVIHFGTGTVPPARSAARGGRRRDRPRLAHAARRGLGAARAEASPSRGTSIPRCCSAPRERLLARGRRRAARAPPAAPATSSTSATASCPARRSRT